MSYRNKATAEALILNYFEAFKVEKHAMCISKWMPSAYLKESSLELKRIGMHLCICFNAVSHCKDFLFHVRNFSYKKIQLENYILLQKIQLTQEHN